MNPKKKDWRYIKCQRFSLLAVFYWGLIVHGNYKKKKILTRILLTLRFGLQIAKTSIALRIGIALSNQVSFYIKKMLNCKKLCINIFY